MPVQAVSQTTPSAGGSGSTLKDLTAAFSEAQNAAPSQAAPVDKRNLRNPQIPIFAQPNIPKDQEGKDKALTEAVLHHDAIFETKLLQAGADPNAPLRLTLQSIPKDGHAVPKDTLDAVKTIVSNLPKGADINAPLDGVKGVPTALDFAIANLTGRDGALDLIKTLVDDGRADLAKAGANGKAPLDLTKGPQLGPNKQAYGDVEKYLHGKVDGELGAAVKNGDGKRATELIKAGANGGASLNGITDKSKDVSVLQYAVVSGQSDVVKAILDSTPKQDRKALINQQWGDGNTALHAAAAAGQNTIYDELKKDGGDDTIKNAAGKTPADLNANARKRGLFLIPAAAAAISITPLGWAAIAAAGVAALAYAVYNRGNAPAPTPATPHPSPFETGRGGPTYSPAPSSTTFPPPAPSASQPPTTPPVTPPPDPYPPNPNLGPQAQADQYIAAINHNVGFNSHVNSTNNEIQIGQIRINSNPNDSGSDRANYALARLHDLAVMTTTATGRQEVTRVLQGPSTLYIAPPEITGVQNNYTNAFTANTVVNGHNIPAGDAIITMAGTPGLVNDPNAGWASPNGSPSDAILLHELIHVNAIRAGNNAPGVYTFANGHTVAVNEAVTVGLGTFRAAEGTENAYRSERGLPQRTYYQDPGEIPEWEDQMVLDRR